MAINEKDRLDLRQELEQLFSNPRFADIAMEAMPPIDYAQLATKRDVDVASAELRGEFAELRGFTVAGLAKNDAGLARLEAKIDGGLAELGGNLRTEMSSNLRLMFAAQLTTTMMLGAWVAAIT